MPPFVPRKRHRSPSPAPTPPSVKQRLTSKRAKPTLFDDVDAPQLPAASVDDTKRLLANFNNNDSADEDSAISEIDSDDFEDVPPTKGQKTSSLAIDRDDDSDDEDLDWEDAITEHGHIATSPRTKAEAHGAAGPSARAEPEIGDISISLNEDGSYVEPLVSYTSKGKKGPSKRERQIRNMSHCLHVQSLMWHNTIRNSWANDKDVQKILVDGLTEGVKREVTRWKEAMGTLSEEELRAKKRAAAAKNNRKKGRNAKDSRGARDWNYEAEHLEQGVPDLSRGDPLLRLLKILASYWRKRFTVTEPALRKRGYMPLKRLREGIAAWKEEPTNSQENGERILDRQEFRKLAKRCEGSRDVGAQLFVALLRGLGLETRMIANLQPVGIGWSKAEEADPKRPRKEQKLASNINEEMVDVKPTPSPKKSQNSSRAKAPQREEAPSRKSTRGNKGQPIVLDDSDSPLSDPPAEVEDTKLAESDNEDSDDLSVVDVTPSTTQKKPHKKFDRDMAFPNYWTEVCSPVSHKWIPIDPVVLSTIASNEELLQTFEPRGKKAEIAKQVICYTIAFASDGSAKDVTVRYLKKHQLPGKTKGMRMPVEKLPVYNRRGKIKRYEHYDWFRTVMSIYDRPKPKRTPADDLEENTDLKPFKPAKGEGKEVAKESLQWYKQSADYVLEQHLRREEALKPGSEPVKTFTAGKGDKAKEHLVFNRADVVNCKTVESWHKEGRAITMGAQPIKLVPVRAVTLVRKREVEDAQRETGEKLKQGLYSIDQTEWIIPPPIKDGVIPKNAYGNMDVYVPTMVPRGAIHLPLKGSAKLCRRLEIDYAEACTGFEFGKQRAVPILTGVVVAKENAGLVKDAWRKEQEELKRKDDTKRTALALQWWRKMVMGMRILERMRKEYEAAGGDGRPEELNPFVSRAMREGRVGKEGDGQQNAGGADHGAGGFFPPGHEEEEIPQHRRNDRQPDHTQIDDDDEEGDGGGFLLDDDEDTPNAAENNDGGFLVADKTDASLEGGSPTTEKHAPITPLSLQSMHKQQGSDEGGNFNASEENVVKTNPSTISRRNRRTRTVKSTKKSSKPRHAQLQRNKRTPQSTSNPGSDGDDNDDDTNTSLTDLSSSTSDIDDQQSNASATSVTWKKSTTSPRVLIAAPMKPIRSMHQAPVRSTRLLGAQTQSAPSTKPRKAQAAKRTRNVKSRYFDDDDDQDDEGSDVESADGDEHDDNVAAFVEAEDDAEDEDEDEDEEVITPRRTTARTRSRA